MTDELKPPDDAAEPKSMQQKLSDHLDEHGLKYVALSLVMGLLGLALNLMPDLQLLLKLEVQQVISRIQDAGR